MKKAEDNKKKQEAQKTLNDLQSQKIENGKSITGGKGTTSENRIGNSSKTSAG